MKKYSDYLTHVTCNVLPPTLLLWSHAPSLQTNWFTIQSVNEELRKSGAFKSRSQKDHTWTLMTIRCLFPRQDYIIFRVVDLFSCRRSLYSPHYMHVNLHCFDRSLFSHVVITFTKCEDNRKTNPKPGHYRIFRNRSKDMSRKKDLWSPDINVITKSELQIENSELCLSLEFPSLWHVIEKILQTK